LLPTDQSERGERIIYTVAAGPDLVFDLVARHSIACDAVRTGLIFAAHSPSGARKLDRRTRFWQQGGAKVQMLGCEQTAAAIGSRAYRTACLDYRGGPLNPFASALGLAQAAVSAGATLYIETSVRRIGRQNRRWVLMADPAGLTADTVIIAT
jgi:glycine/D-amino acid oxidase-like deaminating enzyme